MHVPTGAERIFCQQTASKSIEMNVLRRCGCSMSRVVDRLSCRSNLPAERRRIGRRERLTGESFRRRSLLLEATRAKPEAIVAI